MTGHALRRLKERRIPRELIVDAMKNGRRVIGLDRKATEYTLKNVLGLRGISLVVVESFDGSIITSYIKNV